MRAVAASVVFSLVAIAVDAGAAVLYKLVDPLGRITFADLVPQGFEGTVTRIVVDTESKSIPPERIPEMLARTPIDHESLVRRSPPSGEERLKAAAQQIDAARAALEHEYNNSTESDWFYYRTNPETGASRGPRPEYLARLQAREAELQTAELAYDDLRRQLR